MTPHPTMALCHTESKRLIFTSGLDPWTNPGLERRQLRSAQRGRHQRPYAKTPCLRGGTQIEAGSCSPTRDPAATPLSQGDLVH